MKKKSEVQRDFSYVDAYTVWTAQTRSSEHTLATWIATLNEVPFLFCKS